jgi:hypothetical protein
MSLSDTLIVHFGEDELPPPPPPLLERIDTERVQDTDLPPFVAVSVYVRSSWVEVLYEPSCETLPMPWSIETLSAFDVAHERVNDSPRSTVDLSMLNESHEGESVCVPTVTGTVQVTEPFTFDAVSVNVFEVSTATDRSPSAPTTPTPWLIDTAVAFVVAHFISTFPPPNGSDVGEAIKVSQVGAPIGATVTVVTQVTVLPAFVAVSVNVFVAVTATIFDPSTATTPTPWLIDTPVAFVVAHFMNTFPPPAGSDVGAAVKASHTGLFTTTGG